ncbi:hypothetical protein [Ferrimonas aestuarii]|uniref:Lipoprotein n=1 Tax=Ferrimonas aestuarii TaxID=2569539 RepID=A0A4U1BTD6_9GAMM|nr:hypothetical protein [Ferrimonas aestuarii]TKB58600.1 hypothetical protein FCL42_02300 [Ferrimonas aestuarii]
MKTYLSLLPLLLIGCTDVSPRAIGYIGFVDHRPWAIPFNDCIAYSLETAEPYRWFDRRLPSVSCYFFTTKPSFGLIKVYDSPTVDANYETIGRFQEFSVSESGWGSFPWVYERANSDWYRVAEGWLHLSEADRGVVRFYSGEQDSEAKRRHDEYYQNH